jgi:hypothetical protein
MYLFEDFGVVCVCVSIYILGDKFLFGIKYIFELDILLLSPHFQVKRDKFTYSTKIVKVN